MQIDISNPTLQEIIAALNLKIIMELAPGRASAALQELSTALNPPTPTVAPPPNE